MAILDTHRRCLRGHQDRLRPAPPPSGLRPRGVSFLLLLVCSVLKRTTEFNAVPVMGSVHGVLFILYVVFWADAWNRTSGH